MIASGRRTRFALRGVALAYITVLVLAPLALIFYRALEEGLGSLVEAMTTPDAISAFKLTLITVAIAVPLNTVFGVLCALLLVRRQFFGKGFINAVIDLPFALSPIVIGLSLVLVYGEEGWLGFIARNGVEIIFSTPGIVIACMFVSLPFVVRETMPVLREIGTEQEEAASTLGASSWQTFWRVTLPSIRWGVGYGIVLTTARVLGEFGAVSVVSGSIAGETRTLPLFVEASFRDFNPAGMFGATIVLALLAFAALFAMQLVGRRADGAQTGGVAPLAREGIESKEAAG
jgi:sulfate/thiosulfate transport system permease protein